MLSTMGLSKIYLVLFFAHCAFAGPFLKRSCITDPEFKNCVEVELQTFFKQYIEGDEKYHLKSTDPIMIPSLDVKEEDLEITSKFSNMKVTGFKDVAISDAKVDKDLGKSDLTLKFHFVSEGDIAVVLNSGKTFTGKSKYEGDIEGEIKYGYTKTKENNVEFFEVGKETITCSADNVMSTLDPALEKALREDAEAQKLKPKYEKSYKEHVEKVACEIGKRVFETATENIRIAVRAGI